MNFVRYLIHLFYRAPPGDCFCSTEKYFTNDIVKSPLKREKTLHKKWCFPLRISLRIWSHLLEKSLMENFIFCAEIGNSLYENNVTRRKKNLNTTYIKSSYRFTILHIPLFLFSLLPIIHWKHVFLETMQSHWRFIYYRKLFLTFGNLTLISVKTRTLWKQLLNTQNRKIESFSSIMN